MQINRSGSSLKSVATPVAIAFAFVAIAAAAIGQSSQSAVAQDAAPDPALFEELMAEGANVYRSSCRGCHGRDGEGQQEAQDAAPALAGNFSLLSVSTIAVQTIQGGSYMPPFGDVLSDRQIAAAATYIRNSFGNTYGIATEEDVAGVR